jgi:hypothetical protein
MFDDIARKNSYGRLPNRGTCSEVRAPSRGADALDEVKQCAVANAAILIIAGQDVELHAGRCSRIATARLDNGTV